MPKDDAELNNLRGRAFTFIAPPKLNLRLKIEGRRIEDNYHLLSMLNVTVSSEADELADEITICFGEQAGIRLETVVSRREELSPDLLLSQENLASRAMAIFFDTFQIQFGASLKLVKNIPIGAGLGGGSSDAAAVLRFLSKSLGSYVRRRCKLDEATFNEHIRQLALRLGADVPYLLQGGFCRVIGIGEKVENLPQEVVRGVTCLIVVPPAQIATVDIYNLYREQYPKLLYREDTRAQEFCRRTCALYQQSTVHAETTVALQTELLSLIENDFEALVCQYSEVVRKILDTMRKNTTFVSGLSGSGSALFSIARMLTADTGIQLQRFADELTSLGARVYLCRLLN